MVIFDLLCSQPVNDVKFHGGGEYTKIVFKSFVEMYGGSFPIYACFNKRLFIDEWILNLINENGITIQNVTSREEIIAFILTIDNNTNITFFAGQAYGYKEGRFPQNVKLIGTCHGLRSIEKPFDRYSVKYKGFIKNHAKLIAKPYLKKKYLLKYEKAIRCFDILITDSQHSEYSIRLNFNSLIRDKKIYVFYPLTQSIDYNKDDFYAMSQGYIMMISANRWIKNSYRAVKAIDSLYSKGLLKGIRTRIYGELPRRIQKEIHNKSEFELYGYINSEELEDAYKHCNVLFYPSLNEGFGNVPMEAMKYGKTCVISAICSLPEVYGDSVYYCNPYDTMEMENRLLQAFAKPISVEIIQTRLKMLREKQTDDLQKLCKIIAGENWEEV